MSGTYTESVTENAMIAITSPIAIIDSLIEMGCKIHTSLPAIQEVVDAQNHFDKCLAEVQSAGYMSLEQTENYQNCIERCIQALENLQLANENAENEIPTKIEFNDTNGTRRVLNHSAGAYILEWTETDVRSRDTGALIERRKDGTSRNFSTTLMSTSDRQSKNRKEKTKKTLDSMNENNEKLLSQLKQAIRIREKWEYIENDKRIVNLREERSDTIQTRAKEQGWQCKKVVNTREEIVLSLRRNV